MTTDPVPTFAEVLEGLRVQVDVARDMRARPNLAPPVADYWQGRLEALETVLRNLERVEAWR